MKAGKSSSRPSSGLRKSQPETGTGSGEASRARGRWFTGKSSGQEEVRFDYRVYRLSPAEWLRYTLEAAGAEAAVVWTFYRSMRLFLMILPLAVLWPLVRRKKLVRERREQLSVQFREGIEALSSALEAGYSVENAFRESRNELSEMYGEDAMIVREFSLIISQVAMNRTVEALFSDFAERSGVEEIADFAEIFAVAKRSRGNVTGIIAHVSHVISGKLQVREEIRNMTAEKRFEQTVMNLMPFLIAGYIHVTSPGFFDPMYRTAAGRIVMTGCLGMYLLSRFLAGRFLEIHI